MNLGEIDEFLEGQRKTTKSQATTTTNNTWVVTSLFKTMNLCFPGGSEGKESACNVGDPGLILGSEWSPGEGHGNPFQYSCLENSMTEELVESMALQRVGHDWETNTSSETTDVGSFSFILTEKMAFKILAMWLLIEEL